MIKYKEGISRLEERLHKIRMKSKGLSEAKPSQKKIDLSKIKSEINEKLKKLDHASKEYTSEEAEMKIKEKQLKLKRLREEIEKYR